MVDNLAAHHGEAERAQRSFLNDLGMELVFLPVCSPDLDTVQEVFSKLKYLSKYRYQELVWDNLEYAVLNFLFQNILTFYCLNKEKRMSTSQKLAVTVKLFMVKSFIHSKSKFHSLL